MKKLFTLLLSVFSISAVFAQYGHRDFNREDERGFRQEQFGGYGGGYNRIDNRDAMHRMIERINYRYERKMQEVQYDRFLRPFEKDRILMNLQRQRHEEIRDMYVRMNRRNFDHNDYNRNEDRDD